MTTKIFFISFALFTILSCSSKEGKYDYEKSAMTDSISSSDYLSSNAAIESKKDTARKFVRTADLKFKVKNVIKATYQIENITSNMGGFVSHTHLSSNLNNQTITKISTDSSLESTSFTIDNSITLRIPNTNLDSTLKAIAILVEFMDYRTIKADDIRLQILSNNLKEQRVRKHEKRLTDAIEKRAKKLEETTNAEESLLFQQEMADNARVSNLSFIDRINYSTINIYLYQREEVKRELIINNKDIEAYEPGFGKKILGQ
jgi:hypothetical protein